MNNEQATRMRSLWSNVVLATLDEAIEERLEDIKHKKDPNFAVERIRLWANSKDGRTVLTLAGMHPDEAVANKLAEFVEREVRTSAALRRENPK